MATSRDLMRHVAMHEGFNILLFDVQHHVLEGDEVPDELFRPGRSPASTTVGRWERDFAALTGGAVTAWVMDLSDHPAPDRKSVGRIRRYSWAWERAIGESHPPSGPTVGVIAGDRDLLLGGWPGDLEATDPPTFARLDFPSTETWVSISAGRDARGAVNHIAEMVDIVLPSGYLRILDSSGDWHHDYPADSLQVTFKVRPGRSMQIVEVILEETGAAHVEDTTIYTETETRIVNGDGTVTITHHYSQYPRDWSPPAPDRGEDPRTAG